MGVVNGRGFNGTSTKTRIETQNKQITTEEKERKVLMEHPPKQGLKQCILHFFLRKFSGFNGTSTKTRIETVHLISGWNVSILF